MDFFVSKVALSICALLVIGILGGVTDKDRFVDYGHEIETILGDLCEVAGRALRGLSEGSVLWTVPALSNGEALELALDHGLVLCRSDGRSFIREPPCYLHTWRWDGSGLNKTILDRLDDSSAQLTIVSGDGLLLTTAHILLENELRLLVFASSVPR